MKAALGIQRRRMDRSRGVPLLLLLGGLLVGGAGVSAEDKAPARTAPAFAVKVTGSGRPMILIPGLSCGGEVWDSTVEHFKGDYECHVLTLAGFAGQPAIGAPFLEKVRDAVIAYIRDAKMEKPILVGHSLGAFLSFWVGSAAPDEIGAIVAVDGVPFFPGLRDAATTPAAAQPAAFLMSNVIKRQTPEQFAQGNRVMLQRMITAPAELERMAEITRKSDPQAVGQAMYELMTTDLRDRVSAIRAPVLLVGATASFEDPAQKARTEDNYRAQVASIAQHTVQFAPQARHFIQLDEPDFLFTQIDVFLQKLVPGGSK